MMKQNASPTSQLLMDYEEHLRNTLEKGLDAESYSLHTFESLLTRSMENLGESIVVEIQVLWNPCFFQSFFSHLF